MNIALIFAAGIGQRMENSLIPKQFLFANNKPIIVHTIEKFQNTEAIDKIVVASLKDYITYLYELKDQYQLSKITDIVEGGKTSQESIYNALLTINKFADDYDIILIHDGVRPMIDTETINNNITSVKKNGSAITVSPVSEALVTINNSNNIDQTIERGKVYAERAPQSFFYKDIFKAHQQAVKENKLNFNNSRDLMNHYGFKLHTVLGNDDNIKITTQFDYKLFVSMLQNRIQHS